jgi:hypothetical protein
MRKFPTASDEFRLKPRMSRLQKALLVVVVVVLAPVVGEFVLVHVAKWQKMLGYTPVKAETWISDSYCAWAGEASRNINWTLSRYFGTLPWQASNVIVTGVLLALVGAMMLRRKI